MFSLFHRNEAYLIFYKVALLQTTSTTSPNPAEHFRREAKLEYFLPLWAKPRKQTFSERQGRTRQTTAADIRAGGAPHGGQAPTQIITPFVPGTRRANSSLSLSWDWVEVEGIAHASEGSDLRMQSCGGSDTLPYTHLQPSGDLHVQWPDIMGRTPPIKKYRARQATKHFGTCSFLGRK